MKTGGLATPSDLPVACTPLLRVRDLTIAFEGATHVRAVESVGFDVQPGETVALVGESGSGKSITALSLLGLLPPGARIAGGSALWNDGPVEQDLFRMPERRLRAVRGGEIAMIFQEPMTSLNPVFSVGDQIVEAVRLHRRISMREARAEAVRAMEEVGIAGAARRFGDFPHEFSGGMRQRVMIAMALACRPKLLLADEPTTALDATVQKQVLELLREIKRTRGMAIVLISHDLGVVAENADTVCVMYAGRVVERAPAAMVFARPLHPYTRALLACVPRIGERRARLTTIGDLMRERSFLRVPAAHIARREDHDLPAWWPGTEPEAVSHAGYDLREMTPGHWVAIAAPAAAPVL